MGSVPASGRRLAGFVGRATLLAQVGGAQALGLAVDGRVRVAVRGPVMAFPASPGR